MIIGAVGRLNVTRSIIRNETIEERNAPSRCKSVQIFTNCGQRLSIGEIFGSEFFILFTALLHQQRVTDQFIGIMLSMQINIINMYQLSAHTHTHNYVIIKMLKLKVLYYILSETYVFLLMFMCINNLYI